MDEQTLYAIELAIKKHPKAPVNYLLRGEYWVEMGKLDLAREDFVNSLSLSDEAILDSGWGYIYQSYRDRAITALAKIESGS